MYGTGHEKKHPLRWHTQNLIHMDTIDECIAFVKANPKHCDTRMLSWYRNILAIQADEPVHIRLGSHMRHRDVIAFALHYSARRVLEAFWDPEVVAAEARSFTKLARVARNVKYMKLAVALSTRKQFSVY